MSSTTGSTRTLGQVLAAVNDLGDFDECPATHAYDRGSSGDYPLHKVAIWGDVEAAEILLNNSADIDAQGEDGDTALHRAISDEMALLLLSRGANRLIANRYGEASLEDESFKKLSRPTASNGPGSN